MGTRQREPSWRRVYLRRNKTGRSIPPLHTQAFHRTRTMHMLVAFSVQPRDRAGLPNMRTWAAMNPIPIRFLAPTAPSEWASRVLADCAAKSRNAEARTPFFCTTSRSVALRIPCQGNTHCRGGGGGRVPRCSLPESLVHWPRKRND